MQEDADDVVTFGKKRLRRLFFGDHPFAVDVHGDEAGLKSLTPADLAALHRTLVVSGNAILAVAGDFAPRRLTPKLRHLLARLPRGVLAPVAYYVSEVADELFSGMSSRLFERVREEKGLAYFVHSARVVGLHTAMFYFSAGTRPGRPAEVLAEIEAEIARVQSGGVTGAELRRCQTRLKAARRMGLQTNSARAMQAGLNALYGLPVNDWKNYDAHIDAVTVGDLRRFARACFQRARRTQLVVRP